MTSEDVRRLCRRSLQAFAIRLINGRRFIIPHRDFVWTEEKSFRVVTVAKAMAAGPPSTRR